MMKTIIKTLILFSFFLLGANLSSQDIFWDLAGSSGNWDDASKWYKLTGAGLLPCNCIPTNLDNVKITNGAKVSIPEGVIPGGYSAFAKTVEIGSGGTSLIVGSPDAFMITRLIIGSSSVNGLRINSGGAVSVFARDQIVISDIHNTLVPNYAIRNNGELNIEVNGRIDIDDCDGGIFSDFAIDNDGVIDITNVNQIRGIHVERILTNKGTININGVSSPFRGESLLMTEDFSVLTNTGTITISDTNLDGLKGTDNVAFISGGTINVSDVTDVGLSLSGSTSFTNSANGVLNVSNCFSDFAHGIFIASQAEMLNRNTVTISDINNNSFGILILGSFENEASAKTNISDFSHDGINIMSTGVLENLGGLFIQDNTGNSTSHGIYTRGTIVNKGDITIQSLDGVASHGIIMEFEGDIENSGEIQLFNLQNGNGLYIRHGTVSNNVGGTIATSNINGDPLVVDLGAELDNELGGNLNFNN